MITINFTETELRQVIKALQTRRKKRAKRQEVWINRKVTGQLIIPVEVADALITIDGSTVEFCDEIIGRLESAVWYDGAKEEMPG